MQTKEETFEALQETSLAFSDACNFVLKVAVDKKTRKAIELRHMCYLQVRQQFDLSTNLTVRAIRRVTGNMTRLKGKRKKPKLFKPRSIDYDARIFSYREEVVSLSTTRGRLRIPLILGEHQREALAGQKPTSATVINKSGVWYIHIVVKHNVLSYIGKEVMGVDLGIRNVATTSMGLKIEGKSRQQFKEKRESVRASLQSKGTRGAKKVLKRISGYERQRIKHENHMISKKLVEEAKRHNCGTIRMEQLKNIRSNTKTWNKHRNRAMAGWSFYQLQEFIMYKAAALGIAVELINPAYTSQTCHQCFQLGSRKGERFSCRTCGKKHADVNASLVIALGGAFVNMPELAAKAS